MGVEHNSDEYVYTSFNVGNPSKRGQEENAPREEGIPLYGLPPPLHLPHDLYKLGQIVEDELTEPFMEALDPEFYARYQEGIVDRYEHHSEMPESTRQLFGSSFCTFSVPDNMEEIVQWMLAFDRRFEELQREGRIPTTPSLYEEAERINQQVWHSNGWYREIRTYLEANLPAPDSPSSS